MRAQPVNLAARARMRWAWVRPPSTPGASGWVIAHSRHARTATSGCTGSGRMATRGASRRRTAGRQPG